MRFTFLALLAGLVSASPALAGPDNSFAVRDVRVFDGLRTIPHANVVVRDGRIAAIGRDAAIPRGLSVIEGAGKTLLPGLIDAHVHVFPGAQRDALRFGVTAELDMFSLTATFGPWRAQRDSRGRVTAADTWSAGIGVSAPGGHPARMLPPGQAMPVLTDPADAEAFVAARVAEGSDYIKIILEHEGLGNPREQLPALSRETVCAAIAAAHRHKRKAIVHISVREDARAAIACGADGLAHLFGDAMPDAALLREARRRGVFFETTLSVIAGVAGAPFATGLAADPRVAPFLTANQDRTMTVRFPTPHPESFPTVLAVARALHAAGIPLLAGTDAPGPGTAHGVSLHGELQLLVQAGLTPAEALSAATALPARYFALAGRGRILRGYRADLLLVEGDPTMMIGATLAIAAIWKNGYKVDRSPN
ncbi:amidohydrolase family protein [Sphingomonas sp. LB-2]|uniref:amidohydrolase family protein n=1 Tax=Sphingomonas caeni TaxID=2984949 RepID=UPI0022304506|nr:amidohydrolase family protein [Sphingomonas caeni]MCW3847500.1 amidohydrolase family protein [Sphingomonas caeni]